MDSHICTVYDSRSFIYAELNVSKARMHNDCMHEKQKCVFECRFNNGDGL